MGASWELRDRWPGVALPTRAHAAYTYRVGVVNGTCGYVGPAEPARWWEADQGGSASDESGDDGG